MQAASQLIEEVKTGFNEKFDADTSQINFDDTDSDQSDSDSEPATQEAYKIEALRAMSASSRNLRSFKIGEQSDADKKQQG